MEIEFSWDELMPNEQKGRALKCWYCDTKVRYEDVNVMLETFSDGMKNVYACPDCYDAELEARAEELEASEEPEAECTCRFAGDVAYTEMCELHGGAR